MPTSRGFYAVVCALAIGLMTSGAVVARGEEARSSQGGPQGDDLKGWTIPAGASKEQNPIAETPEILQKGERLYRSKCQRCHGREGRGDGPDADPDKPAGNLTDRIRAAFNPDGIVFYKVWNGRSSPKMPAFKSDISKEDAWTIVHYMKGFRK
jgi:mono/diheme cytochrome c family protein